jgi:hypothetical protein
MNHIFGVNYIRTKLKYELINRFSPWLSVSHLYLLRLHTLTVCHSTYVGIFLAITEQDLSHMTEIPVAISRGTL